MVEGHLWAGSQQTYTQVSNSEDYTERFNQYTGALQGLQQSRQLWGAVYTQITDVEQEVNGILTYDRKVLKYNPAVLKAAHEAVIRRFNASVGELAVFDHYGQRIKNSFSPLTRGRTNF